MATRYGYQYGLELVEKHGWKWADHDKHVFGDRWVIDPVTGDKMDPHSAHDLQRIRDDSAALDAIFNVPFVFWKCPKKCNGMVEWATLPEGMQATCKDCGEKSPLRKSSS